MEGTISVLSDRNIWDHLWRFANFGQSDRNVAFHLTKLMCPVPLFCFLLTRTITKRALAWVGSLQQECTVPMSTWNFRNFKPENFVEWKALMVYNNLLMCLSSITINHWSGLVPVPLLPRPSRSVHFGDVSKTLGPRNPKPIGRTIAENWKKNHCWHTKYQIHLWGSPIGFFNPVISNLISRNPVIPIVIFEIPYPCILSIPNLALVLL